MSAIMLDHHSRSGTMTLDICNEGVDSAADYFVSNYCTSIPQVLANLGCFGTGGCAKVQYTLPWRGVERENGEHRHRLLTGDPAGIVKGCHDILDFADC